MTICLRQVLVHVRLPRSWGLCFPACSWQLQQVVRTGITRDRAHDLADLVRHAARDGDITKEASPVWGQYYRVDWAVPARVDVVLRTIWEIAPGAEIPHLVSVFIR
jgi:hypothetical protein